MKKKKVKFVTEEILKCPECFEQLDQCEKCCVELCIEMGEIFDGYCEGNLTHLCRDCGEEE